MKTTIELPDELLEQVRKVAKREGATLRALIEEALRLALHARGRKRSVGVRLKPFKGDGLTPEFRAAGWTRIRSESYGDRG